MLGWVPAPGVRPHGVRTSNKPGSLPCALQGWPPFLLLYMRVARPSSLSPARHDILWLFGEWQCASRCGSQPRSH